MHPTETPRALEDVLGPRGLPVNARFRNLIASRTVLLGDLLGTAHAPGVRLRHADGSESPLRLVIEGEGAALAQVGLPAELLQALGVAQGLSLPVLSAMAAQMISPLLPSMRNFFEQDIRVRVESSQERGPDTYRWAKFLLCPASVPVGMPCRVREVFSQKLVDLASAIPGEGHDQTRIPLILGVQQRLTPAQLRRLAVGDVIVVDEAQPGRLDLRIDTLSPPLASPRLAVVSRNDGRIEHLSPGAWHEFQRSSSAVDGTAVAVDVVVGRMSLYAYKCRKLVLGQCIADWGSVAWLDHAQLRLCGRRFGTARAMTVAGVLAFEITSVSFAASGQTAA